MIFEGEDYSHLKYEVDYTRNLSTLEEAIDEKTGDGQAGWPDEDGSGEEYATEGDGFGMGYEEYWMITQYTKANGMGNGYWNSRNEPKIDGNGVGQGKSRRKEYDVYCEMLGGILEQLL